MSGETSAMYVKKLLARYSALPISLGILLLFLYRLNEYPFEDAAILFRYAENLGSGNGFVYNAGGEWVDGATDFIFTILLSLFVWLGHSPQLSALLINTVSLLLVLIDFYIQNFSGKVSRFRDTLYASFFTILIPLLSPVFIYNFSGYGTTFQFALVYFSSRSAYKYIIRPAWPNYFLTVAIFGIAILNRNETTYLLILASATLCYQLRANRLLLLRLVLAAIGSVGIAVLVRLKLFGFPFPNAYYIKGGGRLYLESLIPSAIGTALCLVLFVIIALGLSNFGLINQKSLPNLIAPGFVVGFLWSLVWIFLSNEMNQAQRFQFPLLGVLLTLLLVEKRKVKQQFDIGKPEKMKSYRKWPWLAMFICIALIIAMGANNVRRYNSFSSLMDGTLATSVHGAVGTVLKDSGFTGGDYVLATSEAGLVPLITEMNTIDTWGLNSREIAHEGFLSTQDFKMTSPDVIFLHLNWSRVSSGNLNNRWDEMNRNIMCFASQENYYLGAFWSNNPKIRVGGSNSWLVLTRGRDKNINLQVKLSEKFKMLSQKLALDDFTSSFSDWKEKVVDCSNT